MIELYINDIKKYPPLKREEEERLIALAKAGDRASYEKVINSNLRFVFQIAKSYQDRGVDLEDLIAEGNTGLIKAFDRFDQTKGIKFISYAVWWIRQSILSAIYKNGHTIRLPLNKLVNVNKLQRLKVEIEQDLMREPTFEELREFIDSPELIADLQHLHTIIRLDAPRTEQGEASLHEVVFGASSSINEDLTNFETEFKLVIKNFPKREQDIICMYYGVGYDKCFTLREIGEELSLTRERIRQIKEGIIDKIRKRRDGKKLIVYFSQNMYNEDN